MKGIIQWHERNSSKALVIRDPRMPENMCGKQVEQLVSTIDYAPTIVSMAGLEIPNRMQGCDLTPLIMNKKTDNWRDAVFIVNNRSFKSFPKDAKDKRLECLRKNSIRYRAVRTKRWKYVYFHELSPRCEQLYDLKNDPNEMNDLSANKQYSEVLKEMRERCEQMYLESK